MLQPSPAQPRPQTAGGKVPDGHTQCPILPTCWILPCSSSFSCTLFPSCFRGFQPLSFPPLFLPSPFSSSSSFTSSSSSSLSLVEGHMGGGGNFLRVCAVGFPRGAVPLITSQGTAPTIPPLMPRLICWGSGSRSSESQSWVEGALTVPFHRQGNRGQNSSPHISRNLLL